MKEHHQRELEEASTGRVQALDTQQKSHDDALGKLKAEIANLKSDLDDEREAKQRAVSEASALRTRTPPATPTPKAQANGSTVTKDDLAKLHQAHEAKLAETESEFAKQLESLREEKEVLAKEVTGIQSELEREKMEKGMYEEQANDAESEIESYVFSHLIQMDDCRC